MTRTFDPETLTKLRRPTLYALATSEAQTLLDLIAVESQTPFATFDQIDDALLNLVRSLTAAVESHQNAALRLSIVERPYEGLTDEESLTILRNIAAA